MGPFDKNSFILFNEKTEFSTYIFLMCQISCMHFSFVPFDHGRLITHMEPSWEGSSSMPLMYALLGITTKNCMCGI